MNVHAYYQRIKERGMPNGNGNGFVKFTPGLVAEAIIIAGAEEVSSDYEPFKQMRYTLSDGRIWFAALKTGVKIDNLALKPGEAFRVCKRPFGKGHVVDVQRCNGPAPDPTCGTVLAAKLTASIAAARRAGRYVASSAIVTNSALTARNVGASVGVMPYRNPVRSLVNASAPAMPRPRPIRINDRPCCTTSPIP